MPQRVVRYTAASLQPFPDAFRAAGFNICAALAQDQDLCAAIQVDQTAVIACICKEADGTRGPMLADLALELVRLLESLVYHQWPEAEGDALLCSSVS